MAKTIWVVEQGVYSDYRVVGVFSTKERAQYMATMLETRHKEATVSEWPVDPWVDQLAQRYTSWLGRMRYDGTVEEMAEVEFSPIHNEISIWRRTRAPFYKGQNVTDCLQGRVLAKNKTHAIKIFNERRVQLIASGEWKE